MKRIQKKLITYVQTEGHTDSWTSMNFTGPPLLGVQKKLGLYDRSLTCTVLKSHFLVRSYFFKVYNGNSRTMSEI